MNPEIDFTPEEVEQLRLSVAMTNWNEDAIWGAEIDPQLFVNASTYIDAKLIERQSNFAFETCLDEMTLDQTPIEITLGGLVALIGNYINYDRVLSKMSDEDKFRLDSFKAMFKDVCENPELQDKLRKIFDNFEIEGE